MEKDAATLVHGAQIAGVDPAVLDGGGAETRQRSEDGALDLRHLFSDAIKLHINIIILYTI